MQKTRRLARSLAGVLGGLAFLVCFTGALMEISLRIAERAGFFQSQPRLTRPGFYRDDNPIFGVWHPPNARFMAHEDCFQVPYESNSFGMRDPERPLRSSSPRVAVLGDSFVEGIGVPLGRRMTDLLERRTGVPYLDFGTAANFSSTQEWLQYKSLVERFDHGLVLLFALPNNDFLEDDPDRWWQKDRYRPYLRKQDGSYVLWYPVSFEAAQRAARHQLTLNRIYNALYVYRFFSWLNAQIRVRIAQGKTTEFGYVGYVNYTKADLDRLLYGYRQLRDAAKGRPLVIFTIPRLNDLLYFQAHGNLGDLAQKLHAFADQERGIYYVDLKDGFLAHARRTHHKLADYFIPCDGHWNELGHEVAAEIVLKELRRLGFDSFAPSRPGPAPPGALPPGTAPRRTQISPAPAGTAGSG